MRIRHFVSALAAGALLWTGGIVGAQHAFAESDQIGGNWYTWNTSLAPGVTTPQSDADVTWPQTLVSIGQIAPECEHWVQQDHYRGTKAQIREVVEDGILTRVNGVPEDHAIVVEWHFVYGGPCATPEPTPTPTPSPTVEPTPTPEPTSTLTPVPSPTPTVTPEPSPTPSQHTAEPTPSPTPTHQEPTSTPTNSTPAPTPTTKPSVTPSVSPTPSPSKTSVPPKPSSPGSPTSTPPSVPTPHHPQSPTTPSLAETGTDGVVWFVVSLGLLGLGSALVLMNRRKNDGY